VALNARDKELRAALDDAVACGRVTPISIGTACGPATLLDQLGLRKAAYPLDYLTSSLDIVEHCLADDFRTLLDPACHQCSPARGSQHLVYLERFGIRDVFTHHSMPDELPHFERAAARFRTARSPVFIVLCVEAWPDPDQLDRIRAMLRGPLLAYVVHHVAEPPPNADPTISAFRLDRHWDLGRLVKEANRNGLTSRLLEDLARVGGIA
jgi:hypothetical protein